VRPPSATSTGCSSGKRIIFGAISPATGGSIYTAHADGSDLSQVTHDGGDDDPAWGTHPPIG
jgi:hypothetical protein